MGDEEFKSASGVRVDLVDLTILEVAFSGPSVGAVCSGGKDVRPERLQVLFVSLEGPGVPDLAIHD